MINLKNRFVGNRQKLTKSDIVDAVFGVRRRGGVDLWVDIAVVMVFVAGFCNKNSKICIECEKKNIC